MFPLQVQQTSVDDESIARAIAQKLGDTPGVSYSEVANRAIECGRTELAIRVRGRPSLVSVHDPVVGVCVCVCVCVCGVCVCVCVSVHVCAFGEVTWHPDILTPQTTPNASA